MNKRDVVELESAFLAFCNTAQGLGYRFTGLNKLELQHSSESENSMNGRVQLNPDDFVIKEDRKPLIED